MAILSHNVGYLINRKSRTADFAPCLQPTELVLSTISTYGDLHTGLASEV